MKLTKDAAAAAVERAGSLRGAGKALGVSAGSVKRALLAKPPGRVRKAEEFSSGATVTAPLLQRPIGDWTLQSIREARDDQMRGHFRRAVRLAEAMRTDDAIYVARLNRLAPIQSISTTLDPASGSRGEAVAKCAARSVFASKLMIEGIEATLVEHGIAIMQIKQVPYDDGSQVDFHISEWPLEHVRWNVSLERLETLTRWGGGFRPIVHGDGEWIVVRKFAVLPWTQEAALLPCAMLWAGHAYGLADWAQGLRSHGQAKMAAKLPQGSSIEEKDSTGKIALSPEAMGVLRTLQDMVSGEAGAGIFPNGTEVNFLANGSNAWQVFDTFVTNREKSAARVYNGTDATMGSAGGAPGVDISVLFGVASTKVQGDFSAIVEAMNTGAYQPWTAINYGDSKLAPSLRFLIPDPEAAKKSEESGTKRQRFFDVLDRYRKMNMQLSQDEVNKIAEEIGVSPAPQLALTAAGQLQAPADAQKSAILGRELRESLGLPPFGDERDGLTVTAIDIVEKGRADAFVAKAKAAATGQANVAVAEVKVGDASTPAAPA